MKTWKDFTTSLDVLRRKILHMPGIETGNSTHSDNKLEVE
jgi:hypothetical protein